jgi:PEP-CTERM motif
LLSDNFTGIGFDSLELQVTTAVNGTTQTYRFSSLTGSDGAETFFAAHSLRLGDILEGVQSSVSLSYDLTFSAGTLANVGDGFGFTYDIADPRLSGSVPEPSTWAMLIMGFVGLGVAGWRRGRGPDSPPRLAR